MEKNRLKKANRIYLRKVFRIKTLFYPFTILIIKAGLAYPLEKILNRAIKLFGINKNARYFFKYLEYGRLFRNEFIPSTGSTGEILFPVMTGVHSNFTLLNLLLSKYFADSHNLKPLFYICDSAFDICTKDGMLKSREKYPWFCHECWSGYRHIEDKTGIETIRMTGKLAGSERVIIEQAKEIESFESLDECNGYSYENIPVGRMARKSVMRYFLTGRLSESKEVISVYRKFLMASLRYYLAFSSLVKNRPAVKYVILNNGSLVFEAIARSVCEKNNIPYITYETYIGNNSLIYKRNGAVMDLDWEDDYRAFIRTFTEDNQKRERVREFFENMQKGVGMYAVLNREHSEDRISKVKRYACLFTNLNYDTAVIDKNYLFSSMEDWIMSVIEYWKSNKSGITLVIRIHPGEIKLVTASREYLGERIMKACDKADNIIVFDSDETVNSYELIQKMEFGMIYSSTIGLEIAWRGKQCLVAGLPWFRDRSFVIYPETKKSYFERLSMLTEGREKFIPDAEELFRTVYFVYFNRVKRLNGIKLYTPSEERNTELDDPAQMVMENNIFFSEFKDELFGTFK